MYEKIAAAREIGMSRMFPTRRGRSAKRRQQRLRLRRHKTSNEVMARS
jgi:hypothetical protein